MLEPNYKAMLKSDLEKARKELIDAQGQLQRQADQVLSAIQGKINAYEDLLKRAEELEKKETKKDIEVTDDDFAYVEPEDA